jgi:hypothetical protein
MYKLLNAFVFLALIIGNQAIANSVGVNVEPPKTLEENLWDAWYKSPVGSDSFDRFFENLILKLKENEGAKIDLSFSYLPLVGSISLFELKKQDPHFDPIVTTAEFTPVDMYQGNESWTVIRKLAFGGRHLVDPIVSSFHSRVQFSAYFYNPQVIYEDSYHAFLTSYPKPLPARYVNLGTYFLETPKSSLTAEIQTQLGFLAVGDVVTKDYIPSQVGFYKGIHLSAFYPTLDPIDMIVEDDFIHLWINPAEETLSIQIGLHNGVALFEDPSTSYHFDEISNALTFETTLPTQEYLQLRLQFYGPDGAEIGGAWALTGVEGHHHQGAFVLTREDPLP